MEGRARDEMATWLALRHRPPLALAACASLVAACGGAPMTGDTSPALSCALPAVANPDFTSGEGWTPQGGVALTPGSAVFDTATMCAHGFIEQAFPASSPTCARPLVMTIEVTVDDDDTVPFLTGVGGGWNTSAALLGAQTLRICLGANAFGGASTLLLGMGNNPWVCPPPPVGGPTLSVVHASIVDDLTGACPLPGTVMNGDFEGGSVGWTPRAGGGTAEIAPGLGEGGSLAAHLTTDLECETPSISGTLSVPTSAMLPSPALRVWSRGTNGTLAAARIGSPVQKFATGAATLRGTGAPAVTNVCIPRWAQGTVQPVRFSFPATSVTEECATASAPDFVFDGLGFVSEPACAAGANVFDPGFEQLVEAPAVAASWMLQNYEDQPGARITLETDGRSAHGGRVGALLSASMPCPHASLAAGVTVPAAEGARGPALKFWYETRATVHTGLSVTLGALVAPVPVPAADAWTQVTACLDPRLAGRPDLLTFALVSVDGGGVCADTFAAEAVAVDDVELTTDPSCAANP